MKHILLNLMSSDWVIWIICWKFCILVYGMCVNIASSY
jgi:hypothetical protein